MQVIELGYLFVVKPPLPLVTASPWFPTHRLLTSFAAVSSLPHRELLTDSLMDLAFLTSPLDLVLGLLLLLLLLLLWVDLR